MASSAMAMEERAWLSEDELYAFFDRLFPHGFAGADVLAAIAPRGWERSSLVACFHPSVEQIFKEQVRLHRRLLRFGRISASKAGRTPSSASRDAAPTLARVRAEYKRRPVEAEQEATELVGLCAWDIFSDNNSVTASDGRAVDLGSWRGSSAFLDEYSSGLRGPVEAGDDHRFYMGAVWIAGRADLVPVYRLIFERLKAAGADWRYAGHVPAARRARHVSRPTFPAPATVRAYRRVYGRRPKGWSR